MDIIFNQLTYPTLIFISNYYLEKQNVEQEIVTATNDRQNSLIIATTAYLQSAETAEVTLFQANNTINIYNTDVQEEIMLNKWAKSAKGYGKTNIYKK